MSYLTQYQLLWETIEQVKANFRSVVFNNQVTQWFDGVEWSMLSGGKSMLRDNNHLSVDGSIIIGSSMVLKILELGWIDG